MLDGAGHDLAKHTAAVATAVNDWFVGARRLTADDIGEWDAAAAQAGTAQGGARAAGADEGEDDLAAMGF
jgi:hypothetical protein